MSSQAMTAGGARPWVVWLAPVASAALLYLSFFPVACGPLAWVALAPWLSLVRAPRRTRWLYLAAWLGGVFFFWLPVLQWMRFADLRMYFTWVALSLYCAGYAVPALFLTRMLDRRTRLPLVLTFPLVWVAAEFVRSGVAGSFISTLTGSHLHDYPGGFGWYLLGHSQHDFLALIQVADLAGVYAVCFLLAAVNALLFEALYSWAPFRRGLLGDAPGPRWGPRALLGQGAGVAALLVGTLGYGGWRLGQDAGRPGPRVALLQGNIDQRIRIASSAPEEEERERAKANMGGHYAALARLAARQGVDLIVWPETSYPGTWGEVETGQMDLRRLDLAAGIDHCGTPQLLGVAALVLGRDGKWRDYNSAVLIERGCRWAGRYDKMHRVPFGEYVPLRDALPWLKWIAPYSFDYSVSPGNTFTRFGLHDRGGELSRFGVVICYEDTDPGMATPYVGGAGEPVDFLVNISNDGWFAGTSEHDQHLALCRFRAVECRRSVARAVNMGISAVIDGNGRVLAPTTTEVGGLTLWEAPAGAGALAVSDWHAYKKNAGVLVATIPLDARESFYARHGDWFAAGCAGGVLASLVVVGLRRVCGWVP
jgi:apolipoprotein N-acyltransferase